MDERLVNLRSSKNAKARIKVLKGHFATQNAHINTYLDMSTIKSRQNNARETASVLAAEYENIPVSTIVCLDGMEVIGTFLAYELATTGGMNINKGANISIVSPEIDEIGQMVFRDNKQRMIKDQQVLILASSITTGKTIVRALEAVEYYGGDPCGVASIFSAPTRIAGLEVKCIFTSRDLPDYRSYSRSECPMCKAGERLEALVNGYGYSMLI